MPPCKSSIVKLPFFALSDNFFISFSISANDISSAFFNTEWHINAKYPGLGDKVESGWWEKNEYSNHLFTEAFSWHWHNTTHEKAYIEPESKFGLMKTMIDNELYERGILK